MKQYIISIVSILILTSCKQQHSTFVYDMSKDTTFCSDNGGSVYKAVTNLKLTIKGYSDGSFKVNSYTFPKGTIDTTLYTDYYNPRYCASVSTIDAKKGEIKLTIELL